VGGRELNFLVIISYVKLTNVLLVVTRRFVSMFTYNLNIHRLM